MSTTSDTVLNLQYYRKQARALLKSAKSGDAAALQRITDHAVPTKRHVLNADGDRDGIALSDAQRAIAREQGYPTWSRFRVFVLASSSDSLLRVNHFVELALNDLSSAERVLADHPEIESAGLIPALLLGNADRVKSLLKLTPESLRESVGPNKWSPMLYICFSRFASRGSARRTSLAALCRLLLQHGADPNGSYTPRDLPDNPLPCLYGASGLNNNRDMTEALIDAGATLDDTESLYHSTEHADLECLKLLLARGANPNSPNVIFHVLDTESAEALTLLLNAGADVHAVHQDRNQTTLHWAVWRGRSAAIVKELINRGVDLNAKEKDGRTAYATAFVSGQTEVAELLMASGADTALSPLDRFIGEVAATSDEGIQAKIANLPDLAITPGVGRMLTDLAMRNRTAAIRALLQAGANVDSRGDSGASALHWACWHGHSAVVKLLLEAGASLTIEDEEFHSTPPGWFGHGIHYCPDRSGDWLGVARELVAVGATIPSVDLPTGVPEVDAFLKEHGYLTD